MSGTPSAAIVTVGNELLYGETVDTNSAWLGRVLTGWGIEVVGRSTVRDRAPEIQDAVLGALAEADVVVVSGGLGPTPDDLTKAAVAEALHLPLAIDPEVAVALEARFSAGGYDTVPELSRSQAEIPGGATALRNDHGTAPGLLIDHEGSQIVLLPGVPRELKGIVLGSLEKVWRERGLLTLGAHHRVVHTTGVGEPILADAVQRLWTSLPREVGERVQLAFLPDETGVDLRLTVEGMNADEAATLFDGVERLIGPAVEPFRFEAESGDLADAVHAELRSRGLTMAAAESCTGGLVTKRMTDSAGASDVVLGGVVAYHNAVKTGVLGVSAEDLEHAGAVSEAVVRQMAVGVAETFGADCALGITGIAGPGGGSDDKPVGTVWIASVVPGRVASKLLRLPGDRGEIRRRAAQAALALLYHELRAPTGGA